MSLVAYDDSESDEEKTQNAYEEKTLKSKQTVKIPIPTINYDSDDEPVSKKVKTNDQNKKSGLLSILPPPKVQPGKVITLIPNVVKKKSTVISNKRAKETLNTKESVKETNSSSSSSSSKVEESDDSDDEVISNFDEELWQKINAQSKRRTAFTLPAKHTVNSDLSNNAGSMVSDIEIAPSAEKPYEGLDNAAFKELVGRGKQKAMDVNIIDIHEDEIRPDKADWLKSLTDPNYAPKQEVEDEVNDTCKRKHHITYLAQQAKANELELQNQWAQNRFARKQTQAKYGF
ncbi:uncharacterized protein LOC108745175 [Agrilus planipennis]|uniref:Uncharacterized protein LOC108745175 n=1 Tax=Agrilus planipennis TaxID=224129 RepID=A0A1W4XLD1_AGRPL|nr:uncharacterized protein LOC108745175 [Agrilus planipennis]